MEKSQPTNINFKNVTLVYDLDCVAVVMQKHRLGNLEIYKDALGAYYTAFPFDLDVIKTIEAFEQNSLLVDLNEYLEIREDLYDAWHSAIEVFELQDKEEATSRGF